MTFNVGYSLVNVLCLLLLVLSSVFDRDVCSFEVSRALFCCTITVHSDGVSLWIAHHHILIIHAEIIIITCLFNTYLILFNI